MPQDYIFFDDLDGLLHPSQIKEKDEEQTEIGDHTTNKQAFNTGLLIGAIQKWENGESTAEETVKTLKQKMKK